MPPLSMAGLVGQGAGNLPNYVCWSGESDWRTQQSPQSLWGPFQRWEEKDRCRAAFGSRGCCVSGSFGQHSWTAATRVEVAWPWKPLWSAGQRKWFVPSWPCWWCGQCPATCGSVLGSLSLWFHWQERHCQVQPTFVALADEQQRLWSLFFSGKLQCRSQAAWLPTTCPELGGFPAPSRRKCCCGGEHWSAWAKVHPKWGCVATWGKGVWLLCQASGGMLFFATDTTKEYTDSVRECCLPHCKGELWLEHWQAKGHIQIILTLEYHADRNTMLPRRPKLFLSKPVKLHKGEVVQLT